MLERVYTISAASPKQKTHESKMTPQARAEKCAALMWAQRCNASQALGMQIGSVGPGTASLSDATSATICSTGLASVMVAMIFTLADSALAFASNSYNALTVAQQLQITYVTPAKVGNTLFATAAEVARVGRSGTYDVTVTKEDGTKIALFRGLTRSIKGQHFKEDTQ